jgi:hypothetical protein
LHFHDLRGTAITMLAEAGCTPLEVAAITGHTFKHVTHILETYLSRTRRLADAAILKFEKRLRGMPTREQPTNIFANGLQMGGVCKMQPKKKPLILLENLVGAPRFELGTPSPPDWCANRAALRSDAEKPYVYRGVLAFTAFGSKSQ